jgi:signal transduction histidine kinase
VIGFSLVVAGATLATGATVAFALRLLPSLRAQLALLALLAVTLPLAAVFLSGWAMFHMGDDVKILAVAAGSASVFVAVSVFVAQGIGGRIRRLGETSAALAAGHLELRAEESGPRELAELARSFNAMAAELQRLFDARRELVAWASHDLRTPIASLQAMLEAIEDGLATPEQYLPSLQQQVATLARRVDDLFELARIDAGALTLELREARSEEHTSSVVVVLQAAMSSSAAGRNVRRIRLSGGDGARYALGPGWCQHPQSRRCGGTSSTGARRLHFSSRYTTASLGVQDAAAPRASPRFRSTCNA